MGFREDLIQRLPISKECSLNQGIYITKELLGENLPYVIERRLHGSVVILNQHFTNVLIDSMTTDCVAKMNESELNLLFDYMYYLYTIKQNVEYNQSDTEGNTPLEIVKAVDQWLIDEISCSGHPTANACFNSEFKYVSSCTV